MTQPTRQLRFIDVYVNGECVASGELKQDEITIGNRFYITGEGNFQIDGFDGTDDNEAVRLDCHEVSD